MTNPSRRRRLLAPLALVPVIGAAVLAGAEQESTTVEAWAGNMWEAARAGDRATVETLELHFDTLPAKGVAVESADRFRESVDQMRTNRRRSHDLREEQRAEALAEMRTERDAENLSLALREAVKAQTLGIDLDAALVDPEIMELVRWAEARVPTVQESHDWLEAQELLYLLRTFYDDTVRRDEFQRYDEQLERVNRRVALIAQYVPRRLHELRNERAERLGEEGYGEFNPASTVDWRERMEDVSVRTLRSSLRTAATEHIESEGWRPLLEGGLDALELLATTQALAETFELLTDREAVAAWVARLDRERVELASTPDNELGRNQLREMLDDLTEANRATIEIPDEVMVREFGDGALSRLDPYSEIIWPDELRRFQQATAGNFVGVGILIRHNDKREILVVNPLEGTPAFEMGVKPNDLIVRVNGDSTVGWSLNDAVDRITGPRGTVVEIGVRREGVEGLIEIPIERDIIKIRSVKGWWKETLDEHGEPVWDWYIDPISRIAYIRLTQFTQDSYDDLRAAWHEVNVDGPPSGLILDLRHNPGGLLTSAVRISNLFVPQGGIVTGEDKHEQLVWRQEAHPNRAEFAGVPTVVLVNKGSASASEIVAGCLQAHGAAVIVGERTFGKGSVQTVHQVARNSRLKLTTQYYRLPSPDGGLTEGRLVHKRPGAEVWGVDPDIEVPMSAQQVIDAITLRQKSEIIPLDDEGNLHPDDPERPGVLGLITEGTDPQLETALLILHAQALAPHEPRQALRQGS